MKNHTKDLKSNLSKKQQLDLETVLFFCPPNFKRLSATLLNEIKERGFLAEIAGNGRVRKYHQDDNGDDPITCFFDVSNNGRLDVGCNNLTELVRLNEGKRWRGIHMHELYEQGILDGSVPYYVLLGGQDDEVMPRVVVDFMKKEMFRGYDAEIIEMVYQEILDERKVI